MVLILVAVSPVSAFATNDNSAQRMADKPYTFDDSSIIMVGVQQADGSINIVYLNPDNVISSRAGVWGETVSMFPDAMTIVLLGLAGLFYRRRPASASASRRPGLANGESRGGRDGRLWL
jgi:hypothetical protein